jgi:hypothetical protein
VYRSAGPSVVVCVMFITRSADIHFGLDEQQVDSVVKGTQSLRTRFD